MSDTTTEDSTLVGHAERELRLAGLFDDDADYGGAIAEAAMQIVRTFASQGHSGGSAAMTLAIVEKLLRFETLTPLTSNRDEWTEVADGMWQSKRNPAVFSSDAGATWWHVDDGPKP